ncbi:MAG TPA: hypothetical protein DIT97_18010 [Gimesia maris]|uniref:Uncharacterized protein n=1 Tax=Gimesia maris TaxID=122 RepID=A0A3D3R9R6_9PLAN|nr:hypothetical protein [Gimesia maris]|tara:strand:- start:1599 stop:2486 length:888 start_codon:yes stop_codon:yes gene_type:complete
MMSDDMELPSKKDLIHLSERSQATYAIRFALRVQPLLASIKDPPVDYKKAVLALDGQFKNLIYENGNLTPFHAFVAANAVKNAADRYVNFKKQSRYYAISAAIRSAVLAASAAGSGYPNANPSPEQSISLTTLDAAFSASLSAGSAGAGRNAVDAALSDYKKLKESPTEVFDISENGPLGKLWHGSPPDWYLEAKKLYDKTIAEWTNELGDDESEIGNLSGSAKISISSSGKLIGVISDDADFPIEFYMDPGDARKETIQNVLECLSDLHIAAGGFGLEFIADDLNIKAMEGITQ